MNNSKQARYEAQERNKLAQEDWRRLCKLRGEFDTAEIVSMVVGWQERHPGIIPECFRDGSDSEAAKRKEQRWRQHQGHNLVYGKADKYGLRHGNAIARLRVLGGEPQHRVLSWWDVPYLVKYADIPMAQVDPIFMREVNEILRPMMPKRCVYVNDYDEMKGGHTHLLTGQGVTDLGSRGRVIPDENLVTFAGYIGKRLLWTLDNAVCYLIVKQGINSGRLPDKRLPTRLTALGCGVETGVTLSKIVDVLGHPLTRKNSARMSVRENPARTTHSERKVEPHDLPEAIQKIEPGSFDTAVEREYEMVLAAQAEAGYFWTAEEGQNSCLEDEWELVADHRPWGHEVNTEGLWMSEWGLVGGVEHVKPSPLPKLGHYSPEIKAEDLYQVEMLPEILQLSARMAEPIISARMSYAFDDDELMLMGMAS